MFGKSLVKGMRWLGKHAGSAVHAVKSGSSYINHTIHKARHMYGVAKRAITSHVPLSGRVFKAIEASPLGSAVDVAGRAGEKISGRVNSVASNIESRVVPRLNKFIAGNV